MRAVRDLLQDYFETRVSLEDPELVFASMRRAEALAAVRRLARSEAPKDPEPDAGREYSNLGSERGERSSGLELPEEETSRLAATGTAEELEALTSFAAVRGVALRCTRCSLRHGRQHVVFGEGSLEARVVCVGEAPGAVEDETGRPFVGPAGKLLDRLLLSVGFARDEVYICNVLKCRPPGNRDPRPEEIEACSPYLRRQLDLIRPRVVVAFGTFAARTLLQVRESLGRLRGRTHIYRGFPVVVTYHPAALLRNPAWTRPTWEDLQRVREMAEGGEGTARPARSVQGGLFG